MPYRLDLRHPPRDALDRLIDLGALDIEEMPDGSLAALLPDHVTAPAVAADLGVTDLQVSPATARDDGSTWILRPRRVQAGGLALLPADAAALAPADSAPLRGTLRLIDSAAFGTGLHPSTALCLDAIRRATDQEPPTSILDVGTGSGVLALAALARGVRDAVALDIDPAALRVAAANAYVNGLSDRLRLICGGPDAVDGRWPLVVANVLAAPLLDMAPAVSRRVARGGRLVLSGIQDSLAADVQAAYRHSGMRTLDAETRAGWTALTLTGTW